MMNESLRSDIASADPVAGDQDDELHELVRVMARQARATSQTESLVRTRWWKRRRTVIPLGILGVAALTGAAVLIPFGLWVNGAQVELDAEIPIIYTTDSGINVSCRYGIYIGDPANRTPADEQLADFVGEHDWTGIGQRIYDDAIANPFVPGPDDNWEVDPELDTQALRDSRTFILATSRVIWAEIPPELQAANESTGSTSDCTGQLR